MLQKKSIRREFSFKEVKMRNWREDGKVQILNTRAASIFFLLSPRYKNGINLILTIYSFVPNTSEKHLSRQGNYRLQFYSNCWSLINVLTSLRQTEKRINKKEQLWNPPAYSIWNAEAALMNSTWCLWSFTVPAPLPPVQCISSLPPFPRQVLVW